MTWRRSAAGVNCCGMPLYLLCFGLGTDFPPASSKTLNENYGCCMRKIECNSLLTMFKTTKKCPCVSKICRRPSTTTRFIHNYQTLLDVDEDKDGTTDGDLQAKTQVDSECYHFVPNQRNNLFP